jgi:hypothetical protein
MEVRRTVIVVEHPNADPVEASDLGHAPEDCRGSAMVAVLQRKGC